MRRKTKKSALKNWRSTTASGFIMRSVNTYGIALTEGNIDYLKEKGEREILLDNSKNEIDEKYLTRVLKTLSKVMVNNEIKNRIVISFKKSVNMDYLDGIIRRLKQEFYEFDIDTQQIQSIHRYHALIIKLSLLDDEIVAKQDDYPFIVKESDLQATEEEKETDDFVDINEVTESSEVDVEELPSETSLPPFKSDALNVDNAETVYKSASEFFADVFNLAKAGADTYTEMLDSEIAILQLKIKNLMEKKADYLSAKATLGITDNSLSEIMIRKYKEENRNG